MSASSESSEEPTLTSAEEPQISEHAGEEENVQTTCDISNMHGQSQVYTATQDTLFSKEAARPAMHVLVSKPNEIFKCIITSEIQRVKLSLHTDSLIYLKRFFSVHLDGYGWQTNENP